MEVDAIIGNILAHWLGSEFLNIHYVMLNALHMSFNITKILLKARNDCINLNTCSN